MTEPSVDQRLAVYGTLVPGGSNSHQLAGLQGRWVFGTVRGTRFDDGWQGYPGLVLDDAGDVEVAVFESLDLPQHWDRLDAFEGPGYRRVVADVSTSEGQVPAWTYVLVNPPG